MHSEITEKEWQARDDARTLARAEEIKADQERLNAAKTQAEKMVTEEEKELNAIRKVAGRRPKRVNENNTSGLARGGEISKKTSSLKLNVFQRI